MIESSPLSNYSIRAVSGSGTINPYIQHVPSRLSSRVQGPDVSDSAEGTPTRSASPGTTMLRWAAVDLDRGLLFVERNHTTAGHEIVEGDPKTAAGRRAVALDKRTVQVLREHRRRQLDRRHTANMTWTDSGYVFTRKNGEPINPNYATTRFRKLTERAGLPPVRLHDLRHGAASLAHEAGADLKTLQDLLGHSSIVVTADTYTSVLPDSQRRCADATADLVLAAARHTRKRIKEKAAKNRPGGRDEKQTTPGQQPTRTKQNRRSRRRQHTGRHGK
ncbi:site-specific integrase [Actinoplanes sp. Pm04-4]|uniref:Site-specific integrase n=1 Tax=Paractinoplanes pyxinae TaxID=2997416 RepID=A0ABT4B524_9ACTN|nr:site-specific integrase [Actinoplanes pyxinae]MCY1141592.1 site-specific integrase [Actinoplanes pyxinae]